MEAFWKLEEKLKLTTKEVVVILVGTVAAVTLLCIAAAFLNRNSVGKQVAEAECKMEKMNCKWSKGKRRLMGFFCWSSAAKWIEFETQRPPLLAVKERSLNAVWQRPILMGEKCELPRFSGLVWYDECGHPLHHSQPQEQVKHSSVVRTTLRDLL